MCQKAIFILLLINGSLLSTSSAAKAWSKFAENFKNSLEKCPVHAMLTKHRVREAPSRHDRSSTINLINAETKFQLNMFDCIRHSSLNAFDSMIASDVIPLTMEIKLIRKTPVNDSETALNTTTESRESTISKEYWSGYILKNMMNLFSTHTLNIDLTQTSATGRGPHRRRDQMLPMMILGVTALGALSIPMGFQFLSIVSGKALLLAKMALIMAIINGAKRVASSGVHYGLYHNDPHHQLGYQYLNRGDTDQPRSIQL